MDKLCLLFLLLILLLPDSDSASFSSENPFVGVSIGTDVSSLPSPQSLTSLLRSQQITHVRLYDADLPLLAALNSSASNVSVLLGIPNKRLLAVASDPSLWLSLHVLPFRPGLVSCVSLGDDVPSSLPSALPLLLPALSSLHSLLSALHPPVPVSTPLPFSLILDPFPPSQAHFDPALAQSFLSPLLDFLSNTSSPFMLNLYPYHAFLNSRRDIPLENALFRPLPPSLEMVDPNTLLRYTNVFDAMLDAAYFSMEGLGVADVEVLITETGWPSAGFGAEKPYANRDNAITYNSNLIKHVLGRAGTPLRPEVTPSVYIYELFNEDLKPDPVSERNWGLFYGNGSAVYLLRAEGTGGFLANDTTDRTFCVAADGADEKELQAALDWACGPGKADCGGIQPGEGCYEPNEVKTHASYAFDSYYQMEGKTEESCYFQGAAMVTTTDPSRGNCTFPGSKERNNTTGPGRKNVTASGDAKGIHRWWKRRRGSEESILNLLPFALSMMVVITISNCNTRC